MLKLKKGEQIYRMDSDLSMAGKGKEMSEKEWKRVYGYEVGLKAGAKWTRIPTFPKPEFKVGDKVILTKPDLYGCTEGEITAIEKIFAEVDANGKFVPRGLSTLETTIKCFSVPYTFDGETLTVEGINGNRVSKFHRYGYTVATAKCCSLYPPKFLKLK